MILSCVKEREMETERQLIKRWNFANKQKGLRGVCLTTLRTVHPTCLPQCQEENPEYNLQSLTRFTA